jgi:hypothetical protein
MCEQCEDLRGKMPRCRWLMDHIVDRQTIGGFMALLSDYERQLQKIVCLDKK